MTVLDIASYQKKSTRRFILHISLVSFISAAIIVGSILLLLFSKLDYTWNLIVNILLGAILVAGLLFYFLNIFPLDKHYYSLFRKASYASLDHHRRMTFLQEIGSKDIDKVTHRVMQFSYLEGENTYIDNLYVLDSDVSFIEGTNYKLDTYRNIIVSYEVL